MLGLRAETLEVELPVGVEPQTASGWPEWQPLVLDASNSSRFGLFRTQNRRNPPSDLIPSHLTGGQLLLLKNGP